MIYIISLGQNVISPAFATEDEALAYIVRESRYLGANDHWLEESTFGKFHHYLNPRTRRPNKGKYQVSEVEPPA